MKVEEKFRTAQYYSGYLDALKDVFDKLAEMHHRPEGAYNRKEVDVIWEHVKNLEAAARAKTRAP